MVDYESEYEIFIHLFSGGIQMKQKRSLKEIFSSFAKQEFIK